MAAPLGVLLRADPAGLGLLLRTPLADGLASGEAWLLRRRGV